MKSELAFAQCIGVMKLEVQPSESAFGVDQQDSKGEVLGASMQLVKWYELMQFDIPDGHNTCEWTTFILMPRVREMGMQGQRNRGAYKDSKQDCKATIIMKQLL